MKINNIYLGDNLDLLKQIEDNSIDSCVSDFPYNLGFMGKQWDTIENYYQWCNDRAKELFRVLKPGAFCLIFSGTRTQHRMVCAFEDAGFAIKDQIMWVYGQGFPKSFNIGKGMKAIELTGGSSPRNLRKSRMGEDYEPTGQKDYRKGRMFSSEIENDFRKEEINNEWDGWGTALKPTHEPIMMAQKPIEKNYCYNVQKWGVGGLNIDGSRIELNGEVVPINVLENWSGFGEEDKPDYEATINNKGRYPANTIFDEEAGKELDEQTGILISGKPVGIRNASKTGGGYHDGFGDIPLTGFGDSGGASRFFYCAKASQKERTENKKLENKHPTIKPISLIKHLVKLVTPPNGTCIDICEGAGSHALACIELTRENYSVNYIGFENDKESVELTNKRIEIH